MMMMVLLQDISWCLEMTNTDNDFFDVNAITSQTLRSNSEVALIIYCRLCYGNAPVHARGLQIDELLFLVFESLLLHTALVDQAFLIEVLSRAISHIRVDDVTDANIIR